MHAEREGRVWGVAPRADAWARERAQATLGQRCAVCVLVFFLAPRLTRAHPTAGEDDVGTCTPPSPRGALGSLTHTFHFSLSLDTCSVHIQP